MSKKLSYELFETFGSFHRVYLFLCTFSKTMPCKHKAFSQTCGKVDTTLTASRSPITDALTHSLTVTHSRTHSRTHSLTHSLSHRQLCTQYCSARHCSGNHADEHLHTCKRPHYMPTCSRAPEGEVRMSSKGADMKLHKAGKLGLLV